MGSSSKTTSTRHYDYEDARKRVGTMGRRRQEKSISMITIMLNVLVSNTFTDRSDQSSVLQNFLPRLRQRQGHDRLELREVVPALTVTVATKANGNGKSHVVKRT